MLPLISYFISNSYRRYSACVCARSGTLSLQFTIIGIMNQTNGTSHDITTGVLVIISVTPYDLHNALQWAMHFVQIRAESGVDRLL